VATTICAQTDQFLTHRSPATLIKSTSPEKAGKNPLQFFLHAKNRIEIRLKNSNRAPNGVRVYTEKICLFVRHFSLEITDCPHIT
jgi:hypothetical protein